MSAIKGVDCNSNLFITTYLDASKLVSQVESMLQNSLLVSNMQSSLTLRKLCCSSFIVGQVFVKFTTFTSLCSALHGIRDSALKKDVSSFSKNMLSGLKRQDGEKTRKGSKWSLIGGSGLQELSHQGSPLRSGADWVPTHLLYGR